MDIGLNMNMILIRNKSIVSIQMDIGINKNMMSNGNKIYFEDSNGYIIDNRPKGSCNDKVVEIEGKKYKLTEI
jgi:hypothetical protein